MQGLKHEIKLDLYLTKYHTQNMHLGGKNEIEVLIHTAAHQKKM